MFSIQKKIFVLEITIKILITKPDFPNVPKTCWALIFIAEMIVLKVKSTSKIQSACKFVCIFGGWSVWVASLRVWIC